MLTGKWSKRERIGLFFLLFFCVALFWVSPNWAAEKAYPNKPISLVIPWAPGASGSDTASRFISDKLSEVLGQPIVSDYKPGGGGGLAGSFVAKAKPDGYTLICASTSSLVTNPILRKTNYTMEDFIPLGVFALNPNRISVQASSKWKTLKDFVEEAKAAPGKLVVGSYGKFSVSHFVLEAFSKAANITLTHLPYKGPNEALTALMGGHVSATITTGVGGLTDSPLIKVLAVCGEKRLETHPEIPTFNEYGYPIDYVGYYCFAVPKGTPKEIVDTLSSAQKKVYDRYSQEIMDTFKKIELVPNYPDPAEAVRKLNNSREEALKMVKELGIVVQ